MIGRAPREAAWDPAFTRRSPLFAPIAEVAELLAGEATFPSPERLDALLAARAGVRFERAAPKPRRRGRGRPAPALYDARISLEGVVPTRADSWHDLLNALVWATFPKAKRALHARQHALVVPAAPGEVRHRPRALDALALFDEGGVVESAAGLSVFGHAVYEGLVEGWPAPTASALAVEVTTAALDASLAQVLSDPAVFADPGALRRVDLGALAGPLRTPPPIPLTD